MGFFFVQRFRILSFEDKKPLLSQTLSEYEWVPGFDKLFRTTRIKS